MQAANPHCFVCEKCCFETGNKKDFSRHLSTQKHRRNHTSVEGYLPFACACGKLYKYNRGLWNHQKKCKKLHPRPNEASDPDIQILSSLVIDVVRQNQELTDKLATICSQLHTSTTSVHHTTINSNKTFNLNFFLNQTCKHAMNINEFIDSLCLQFTDLENVGKLGFVNGISNIIVSNLNALDESTRPIHCTDRKREIFYIRDENRWEKENQERRRLKTLIRSVSQKNEYLLHKFKETYPDCNYSNSRHADKYSKLAIEAYGGSEENQEGKIIRKIANYVTVSRHLQPIESEPSDGPNLSS